MAWHMGRIRIRTSRDTHAAPVRTLYLAMVAHALQGAPQSRAGSRMYRYDACCTLFPRQSSSSVCTCPATLSACMPVRSRGKRTAVYLHYFFRCPGNDHTVHTYFIHSFNPPPPKHVLTSHQARTEFRCLEETMLGNPLLPRVEFTFHPTIMPDQLDNPREGSFKS